MAPGLSPRPEPAPPGPRPGTADRWRLALVGASVVLLLLVGWSRPNAAQPDLAPSGWAPGTLVPLTLSPAAVTAVLWSAYVLGALGVWLGLRTRPTALRTWWLPVGLAVLALLAAPFGSADHVNYLAYGRILDQGGDPWLESPGSWAGGADPVTSRVEAPWTEEPSIYGPFATALHGLAAAVGGDSLRQGVWVWQLLVVIAWLGVRVLLRYVLGEDSRGRLDVLWTLNPLVLGVGVLGAHVDVVASALAVAAVVVAARWRGAGGAVLAGAVAGLALCTKVTYAVVLVGVVAAWWLAARSAPHDGTPRARPGPPLLARMLWLAVGVVAVSLPLHLWAGPHVYDQLGRSRQAVSLATPWRLVLESLAPHLGGPTTRTLIAVAAAGLALVLAWLLLRLSRADTGLPGDDAPSARPVAATALWVTACLGLAYSLAAPYSLPWYDVLVWSALPALLPGVVDLVALGRLLVMACAYVPGRVLGMTPAVERLTLGFRRRVAPWLLLGLWAAVIAVGVRRGSRPTPGPPREGGTPTPTR